jgi:3-hydroxyacyl-[acyl-carrier-protein] dehydratase
MDDKFDQQTAGAPADGLPPVDVEVIEARQLMTMIPHRYPFLLIDRLVEVRRNHSAVGIKNVTVNENFFQGHFPGHPVMPGVLIVESMAQSAAALVIETVAPGKAMPVVYFMSIDNAKFRRPVVPGDQLRIHVTKNRNRGNVWRFDGEAKVAGVVVAEASFTAMIIDNPAAAGAPAAG